MLVAGWILIGDSMSDTSLLIAHAITQQEVNLWVWLSHACRWCFTNSWRWGRWWGGSCTWGLLASLLDCALFGVSVPECPLNALAEAGEVATSVTVLVTLALGQFLCLLFFLGFTFLVTAPEGQHRLTEKPELEDLAVHRASDSFRSEDWSWRLSEKGRPRSQIAAKSPSRTATLIARQPYILYTTKNIFQTIIFLII